VSPVTPFNVIVTVLLPAGGIIVQALGVVPPAGGVIVFAPLARVTISIWPGLVVLAAALNDCEYVTSPVSVTVTVLFEVTAMLLLHEEI